jgi:hypothetical protein
VWHNICNIIRLFVKVITEKRPVHAPGTARARDSFSRKIPEKNIRYAAWGPSGWTLLNPENGGQ